VESVAQPDGKFVVAGSVEGDAMLARFNADGTLDKTFGANGVARLDLGGTEAFTHVFILDSGKILTGGSAGGRGFFARFRADGVLDASTRFGQGDGIFMFAKGEPLGAGMTVGDGRIYTVSGNVLRRHNVGTGTLDSSFDGDGRFDLALQTVLDGFGGSAIAVSSSGNVAVIGAGKSDDATERKFPQRLGGEASRGGSVVLLNADGTLDNTFDANGVSFFGGNGPEEAVYAPDGTLFVAAVSPDFQFETSVGLYEFPADGSFVFNPSRVTNTPYTIARLSNGKIVVAGQGVASRFNADGTLDTTYSTDGTAEAPLLFPNHRDLFDQYGNIDEDVSGDVVLPDGSVVFASRFYQGGFGTNQPITTGPLVMRKVVPQPPSIAATAVLGGDGTLTITGTPANDAVGFSTDGEYRRTEVRIDGQLFRFPINDVDRLVAHLGDGNDFFDGSFNSPPVPLWVDGEAGNDQLFGGGGADTLIGGLDADYVSGYGGDDSLYGSGGKDTLYGDEGRDRLDGGRSNDALFGGASNDRLIGGDGIDEMFGEGGDDLFYSRGDSADDNLFGGSGNDSATADADDVLASIEVRLP
jgi:uncharacterized delta-60 repeat protein